MRISANILSLAIVIAFAVWPTPAHSQASAKQRAEQGQTQRVPAPEPSQGDNGYHPDCTDPPDRDTAEFCQQERMATAAVEALAADRESLRATRDQNNAVYLTLFLSLVTSAASVWIAWRATSLANRALLLEQPPKLTIEQVDLPVVVGRPKGEAFVVNRGSLRALILRSELWVIKYTKLPARHPTREPRESAFPDDSITPGDHRVWSFEEVTLNLTDGDVREIASRQLKLAVVGIVSYRGTLQDRLHHTLFCREYNPDTKRYEPVSDADYEVSS